MKTIKISKNGNYLITRNNISAFFDSINNIPDKEINLNFDSIHFISRSCADEYVKLKQMSDKTISETNLSPPVKTMINLVISQRLKNGTNGICV